MSDPIDLCTLDQVKTYLGGPIPPSLDPVLQQLITAASAYVMSACNRTFKSANYTETYDGTGTERLLLKQTPVTAVASVEVDGLLWNMTTSARADGYQFDATGLYATGCAWFPYVLRVVKVAYTAGYTTIPADLAQAVVEMVCDKYKRRDNLGIAARQIAGETISYTAADVPKSAKPVLQAYTRVAPL